LDNERLVISSKKYKGESNVVSARLPVELVDTLDEIASQTGRKRNEIIQMCLEFSIERLEIK